MAGLTFNLVVIRINSSPTGGGGATTEFAFFLPSFEFGFDQSSNTERRFIFIWFLFFLLMARESAASK